MLGVEAVAERVADHVVGHHPTMPGAGKTAQAVVATRRLENSLHASIMTIVPCLCKTMAALSGVYAHDPRSMDALGLPRNLAVSGVDGMWQGLGCKVKKF
jgi:hypothetical protein